MPRPHQRYLRVDASMVEVGDVLYWGRWRLRCIAVQIFGDTEVLVQRGDQRLLLHERELWCLPRPVQR